MTRSFTKSLTSLKSPTSHRRNRRARRPQAEALEGRLLLTAGDLDPSFGSGGYVLTNSPDYAVRTARPWGIKPMPSPSNRTARSSPRAIVDGRVLRRPSACRPDGSPDAGFGSGGYAVPLTGGVGYDMTVDTQGRILMTGYRPHRRWQEGEHQCRHRPLGQYREPGHQLRPEPRRQGGHGCQWPRPE